MAYTVYDGGGPGSLFSDDPLAEGTYIGAQLEEGDFELDGFLTGEGFGVYLKQLAMGSAGLRGQDATVPGGDGLLFGRDYLGGPVWDLSFAANHGVGKQAEARAALGQLAKAWLGAASRRTPGEHSVLRYCLAGKTRLVYGRPRNFRPDVDPLFYTGLARAVGQFQTDGPLHYADHLLHINLQIVVPSTSVTTWPGVWPLIFSPGSTRQGVITNVGGEAPAPFELTFQGPITNPYARSEGWEIQLNTTLAHDQSVTVDTRTGTVLRNDGTSLAGALTRATYLEEARLNPGSAGLEFGGIDPSGTATCRLQWRPAYYGF